MNIWFVIIRDLYRLHESSLTWPSLRIIFPIYIYLTLFWTAFTLKINLLQNNNTHNTFAREWITKKGCIWGKSENYLSISSIAVEFKHQGLWGKRTGMMAQIFLFLLSFLPFFFLFFLAQGLSVPVNKDTVISQQQYLTVFKKLMAVCCFLSSVFPGFISQI